MSLNSTYEMCRLALSFFLCVKTNIGYDYARSSLVQTEQCKPIEEALAMIEATIVKDDMHIQFL